LAIGVQQNGPSVRVRFGVSQFVQQLRSERGIQDVPPGRSRQRQPAHAAVLLHT
jgi:hypothetical protein